MKIKFLSIIFSTLYKKKKEDMLKEVELLEELEQKSILTTKQSKRLRFLLKLLRELEGIPEFNTIAILQIIASNQQQKTSQHNQMMLFLEKQF